MAGETRPLLASPGGLGGAEAFSITSDLGSIGEFGDTLNKGRVQLVSDAGALSDDPYERDAVASSLTGVFNLANAAIGAGVLAFPFAFAAMGWAAALVLTAIVIVTMGFTASVLSRATAQLRVNNYGVLVEKALGPRWGFAGKVTLCLYLLGACTGYLRVISDMTVPLAQRLWGIDALVAQPFVLVPLCACVVVLPLAMLPRVDFLAPASFIAVASCLYVAVFVWVEGIAAWTDDEVPPLSAFRVDLKFFQAAPLVAFAFTTHGLVPTIFAAVRGHNPEKFRWTVAFAYVICCALYIPTGFLGAVLFSRDTEGDILLNFSEDNPWADAGRVFMTVTVLMAYPMNQFPARAALAKLVFPDKEMENFGWIYNGATFAIFATSVTLAIVLPGLQTVLGLFGATFGVALVFVFPAALNLRLASPENRRRAWIESCCIGVVGVYVGIAGGAMTLCGAVGPCKTALGV
jgi:solute carrier family 38 (sodium-coupled neutral amino acid transporter), member 7/8